MTMDIAMIAACTARAEKLRLFFGWQAAMPFAEGKADCGLMLADWLCVNGYADPAADLRGTYRGAMSCARLLKQKGGLMRIVAGLARRASLERADDLRIGDVGVIDQAGRETGAIFDGSAWRVKGGYTVHALCARAHAAWHVAHGVRI